MQKSGSQVALKVISIIQIVIAILGIILSLVLIASGPLVGSLANDPEVVSNVSGVVSESGVDMQISGQEGIFLFSGFVMILGVIALIGSVFDLIVGILGVRGANNPAKIGPFFVFAIIGLILAIGQVIFSIVGLVSADAATSASASSTIWSSIIQFGLMIVIVALANNIRHQRDLRSPQYQQYH